MATPATARSPEADCLGAAGLELVGAAIPLVVALLADAEDELHGACEILGVG